MRSLDRILHDLEIDALRSRQIFQRLAIFQSSGHLVRGHAERLGRSLELSGPKRTRPTWAIGALAWRSSLHGATLVRRRRRRCRIRQHSLRAHGRHYQQPP